LKLILPRLNGADALIMTKLDVLSGFPTVKICTAYRVGGQDTVDFPARIDSLDTAEPVVERVPGWKESVKDCRDYADLPAAAREYIEYIEDFLQTPVQIVSVGPNRSETILRRSPWTPS
jgi:adenylosuccinate synthase